MSQNNERYIFNFKLSYVDTNIPFSFQSQVTIKFFKEFITEEIQYLKPNNEIEIVEIQNLDNIIDFTVYEMAAKINYSDTLTLEEVFGSRWRTISFYIRLIPIIKN